MNNKEVLLENIKRYNEAYRQGAPIISDAEYDQLIDELKTLDPNNDWFNQIEPSPVSNKRKVKLPIPMKSLNKVKSLPEIQNWIKSLSISPNDTVVVTPKFDGLSLLYSEKTGQAYSRGGIENEGQDCTEHYNMLRKYEYTPQWMHVFGEFVFNRKQWTENFEGKRSDETGDPYKSPRNTAAGFLNRDNASSLIKHVDFFRYGVDEYSTTQFDKYEDLYTTLCQNFQQLKLFKTVKIKDLTEDSLMELFKNWSNLYYIDGLVIYINDIKLWDSLGRHQTTGNPLYAIAYKHPEFTEAFETTVKGITWKVSKAGALKPVVNIETVNTGDCEMENPTGYNAGWINNHEIAKGAKILVTRSGGVIPKILQTLKPAPKNEQIALWDEMCECPHCGYSTQWNKNLVELCCTNPHCPGIKLAKIVFFYNTCGAENMGEETIAKIFDAGFDTITKMLNVTFDDLYRIDGFGESLSNVVLDNNKRIMTGVDMATLMQASDCFAGIGKIKAQKILDDMADDVRKAFYESYYIYPSPETSKFKELPITQQNFILGVTPFFKFLAETKIPVIKPTVKFINTEGKCAGMNVCVSGFRDNELERIIEKEGGTMVSGVSKKTTHLVVKDKNATSSKISKAHSLGITIMSFDEFKKVIL